DSGRRSHPAEALRARHSAAGVGGRDVPDWFGYAGTDLQAERRRHPRHTGLCWRRRLGSALLSGAHHGLGQCDGGECGGGFWGDIFDRGPTLELHRGGGCASHCAGKETVTINLSHFSAAVVFALFASVVFGITQKNSTIEQVKYGLQCFAMFVGGVFLAGWVMALIRREGGSAASCQFPVLSSLSLRFSAFDFGQTLHGLATIPAHVGTGALPRPWG